MNNLYSASRRCYHGLTITTLLRLLCGNSQVRKTFDARETQGLETYLEVLGVRHDCWTDLEVLGVPSHTELTQRMLISLGLSNIFLSLRQWGSKAVCKSFGFFLCGVIFPYFLLCLCSSGPAGALAYMHWVYLWGEVHFFPLKTQSFYINVILLSNILLK